VIRGVGLVVLGASASAKGQRAPALPRVAFLTPGPNPREEKFWAGMRELGYVAGRNMVVVRRSADGDFARLPILAAEVATSQPDVIVAVVSAAALAARQATSTIPIVMVGVGDPVGTGLVASLARPGGNVTGTASQSTLAAGKLLEIVRQMRPGARRLAALWNPVNSISQQLRLGETYIAAARLNLLVRVAEVRTRDELERTFQSLSAEPPDAVLVPNDTFFLAHGPRVAALGLASLLPVMSTGRQLVEDGCLASYGADLAAVARRSAMYVHRILKGAKPGDLPIELPTKFELVINQRTADMLGMAVPASVIARADEVIR
jgi:putative ABC transport system substrate-binding protein